MAKMNLARDQGMSRLRRSFEFSRRKLGIFRRKRLHFIRQYVGANYSEDGARRPVPVNMIELAINVYRRHLAASAPQVIVSTRNEELDPQADEFEMAINHLLREIDFESTIQAYVTDALISVGIMKVGVTMLGEGEIEGYLHDAGMPFADTVDLDDWVHDQTVKRYEQIQYSGNRYRLPVDFIQESDQFRSMERHERINASERSPYDEEGYARIESISTGEESEHTNEFDETLEVWDIWIPREQVLHTFLADTNGGISDRPPIRTVEWEGPEIGPYHLLSFNDVPNNVMPLSPISLLIDLHDLGNRLFRKLARQADRQKTVTIVQGAADADGKRILNADDGAIIRSDRPEGTREARFGGIDQQNLGYFLQVRDLFGYLGGNLDALGGLGPQSETFSQDRLLASNASMRIVDMQEKASKAIKSVIDSMADYLWFHPLIDLPMVKPIEGTGVNIPMRFSAELKEGDRLDFDVDITPFSMQSRSPSERLQTISQVVERFYLPLAGILQQQGIVLDAKELFEQVSKLSNVPEINKILTSGRSEHDTGLLAQGGQETRQAPVTTRNQVRRSVPQMSRRGADQQLSQILLGGQNGQQNSVTPGLSPPGTP